MHATERSYFNKTIGFGIPNHTLNGMRLPQKSLIRIEFHHIFRSVRAFGVHTASFQTCGKPNGWWTHYRKVVREAWCCWCMYGFETTQNQMAACICTAGGIISQCFLKFLLFSLCFTITQKLSKIKSKRILVCPRKLIGYAQNKFDAAILRLSQLTWCDWQTNMCHVR